MTFGEKLKEARKESGLSQEQLAEKMCVSRSAIAKWETVKRLADVATRRMQYALKRTRMRAQFMRYSQLRR